MLEPFILVRLDERKKKEGVGCMPLTPTWGQKPGLCSQFQVSQVLHSETFFPLGLLNNYYAVCHASLMFHPRLIKVIVKVHCKPTVNLLPLYTSACCIIWESYAHRLQISLGLHLDLNCFNVLVESRKNNWNVEMTVYIAVHVPSVLPLCSARDELITCSMTKLYL